METPFTDEEVAQVLYELRDKKKKKASAGFITLSYLLPIRLAIAPVLAALFNACVRLGSLFPTWSACGLTSIPKPGGDAAAATDPLDPTALLCSWCDRIVSSLCR